MSYRQWVEAKEDIIGPLSKNGPSYHYVIACGSIGRIYESDGELMVAFPEAHIKFDLTYLRPLGELPDIEEMIDEIAEYEGHHAKKSQFQFNIKTPAYDWPDVVENYSNKDAVWDEFYYILNYELKCFLGAEDTADFDGAILKLFPWINSWHTDGNSGGWLVVNNSNAEQDSDSLKYAWIDYVDLITRNIEDGAIEDAVSLKEECHQFVLETADLYYSLKFIKKSIEVNKENLEEYMKTEECWEHLIEQINEREEEVAYAG